MAIVWETHHLQTHKANFHTGSHKWLTNVTHHRKAQNWKTSVPGIVYFVYLSFFLSRTFLKKRRTKQQNIFILFFILCLPEEVPHCIYNLFVHFVTCISYYELLWYILTETWNIIVLDVFTVSIQIIFKSCYIQDYSYSPTIQPLKKFFKVAGKGKVWI